MKVNNQRLAEGMVLAVRASLGSQLIEPAELMLAAIVLLWPACPDLVELNAIVLHLNSRNGEALALLHGHDDSRALSIRAACLMHLNDPDWREPLMEVLMRNDDEMAVKFANRLFEISGESPPCRDSVSLDQSIREPIFLQGAKA